MAKKLKPIAGQTKKRPGRPRKTESVKKKPAKKRQIRRWSPMRVRHILYTTWPGTFKSFEDTKELANDIINDLIARGYRKVTIKGVRAVVKDLELITPRKKKPTGVPDWRDLIPEDLINNPIVFYHAQDFCNRWASVHPSVYCFSKDIWKGRRYYGGAPINYGESFGDWARRMYKLQKQKKGDYNIDWHFIALTPIYDPNKGEFQVKIISGNDTGEHLKYKDDGTTEPGEEVQVPLPKGRIEPIPEKPKPEEKIPEAPTASTEFTKEDRIELEKEKIRAEAESKEKVDVKKAKLDQFTKLFSEGKITFEQYERLVSTL